jgi:hypothetical protein
VRARNLSDDAVVSGNSRGRAVVAELAHDTLPVDEVNEEQRPDRPSSGSDTERRELGRQIVGIKLK